jgi:pimeloyl-ACP methyl ester carboxylesterase
VQAARARLNEFSAPFQRQEFQSLDGTPLVGALAIQQDKAKPGVVLVHGFTETKNQKYLMELGTLLYHNGWHVLAMDLRGHGESRTLSPALITFGWKEADDILAGTTFLRDRSQASSVAVLGFSMGARSAVKAMIKDGGQRLQAGMAFSAPIGEPSPVLPPNPAVPLTPVQRFFLSYLGAASFFDYYERSASAYGVSREFLVEETRADTTIAQVKAPLLMVYAFDDSLGLAQLRQGRHDGGSYSLRYRDAVQDHPHVGTLLVDRGGHAGLLYLSDPHWFGTLVLTYLQYWQARQTADVTVQVPPVGLVLEGKLGTESATYTALVRNHGKEALTNVTLSTTLLAEAKVLDCWVGGEALTPCQVAGSQVTWTIPRLSGGKHTAGPFVMTISTVTLPSGKVEAKAWVDTPGTIVQEVTLEKK